MDTFTALWEKLKAAALASVEKLATDVEGVLEQIIPVAEQELFAVFQGLVQTAIDAVLAFAGSRGAGMAGPEKLSAAATIVHQAAEVAASKAGVPIPDISQSVAFTQQAYNAVKTSPALTKAA